MRSKLLVVFSMLLALSSVGWAQPFVACIGSIDFVLTNSCEPGGTPIPDGTPVYIYYDANSNGPDASDALVVVCDAPPNCETGPAGTYNFNMFTMNGEMQGTGVGTFVIDPCFVSVGITPTPARYYLRVSVPCPAGYTGNITWTSSVMTFVVGPQEVWLGPADWTCTSDCTPVVGCTPHAEHVNFEVDLASVPGPQHGDACVYLEPMFNTQVCVGPLGADEAVAAAMRPDVVVGDPCCDTVAAGFVFEGGLYSTAWVLNLIDGQYYYCNWIYMGEISECGCIHLIFDFILPVEMGTVTITPADNSVNLAWNTRSETNVAAFEIMRDHALIARVDAANSPTGHEYTYADNSALNGTTYTYELVLVNANGTREVVKTETVTPSMDKAVVTEYALHQNFPNPFNPTTSIRFDLVEKNFVTLKVYNMTGQEVATVVNGERSAGVNIINFDARNLTSGLYFYTLKVGNVYTSTKKMLLVK